MASKNMVYFNENIGVTVLFFIFCSFSLSFILNLTPLAKGYGELVGVVALISEVPIK